MKEDSAIVKLGTIEVTTKILVKWTMIMVRDVVCLDDTDSIILVMKGASVWVVSHIFAQRSSQQNKISTRV